eukprot:204436_1
MGYDKNDIIDAINDANQRLSWKIHSSCSLYSRKSKRWFNGEIIDILVHPEAKEKWLLVQYNDTYTKKIQRFNKNIKPINCNSLIPIISFIANKLRTQTYNVPEHHEPTKTSQKIVPKRRKKKKNKHQQSVSLDVVESPLEPHKLWYAMHINTMLLLVYGFIHRYEAQTNSMHYIPDNISDLITTFVHYNKYVEVQSQKPYDHTKHHGIGKRVRQRLNIETNALFEFYSSRCPECNRISTTNSDKLLAYRWSLRGKYSIKNKYRNKANVYECTHCGCHVIVNVKEHCFHYSLDVKCECFVTPFGNEMEMKQIRENNLNDKYLTCGQCQECKRDTIQLYACRDKQNGFLVTQARYCISCGLFHRERRVWPE